MGWQWIHLHFTGQKYSRNRKHRIDTRARVGVSGTDYNISAESCILWNDCWSELCSFLLLFSVCFAAIVGQTDKFNGIQRDVVESGCPLALKFVPFSD